MMITGMMRDTRQCEGEGQLGAQEGNTYNLVDESGDNVNVQTDIPVHIAYDPPPGFWPSSLVGLDWPRDEYECSEWCAYPDGLA